MTKDINEEEVYLTNLLGDTAKIRILEFLIQSKRDIPISELSRKSGVARSAIYPAFKDFLDDGIIEETRIISKSKFYHLANNELTASLKKVYKYYKAHKESKES